MKSQEFEESIVCYCNHLSLYQSIEVNSLVDRIISRIIQHENIKEKQTTIHKSEIAIILSALRSYPKIYVRDPSIVYYNVFIRGNHYMLSEKIILDACNEIL